jgi:CheY-like chemotaxis protein
METPTKKRLLTVDDDPKITAVIRFFLEKTGRYVVEIENRPGHAVEIAREVRPDLILLDLNMPGQDGEDLAAEIHQDPEMSGTPILFITGQMSASEAARVEKTSPGLHLLTKPFTAQQLVEKVDQLADPGGTSLT